MPKSVDLGFPESEILQAEAHGDKLPQYECRLRRPVTPQGTQEVDRT
jgi:hypothetical protein